MEKQGEKRDAERRKALHAVMWGMWLLKFNAVYVSFIRLIWNLKSIKVFKNRFVSMVLANQHKIQYNGSIKQHVTAVNACIYWIYNGWKWGHRWESTVLHKVVYKGIIFCKEPQNPHSCGVSKLCLAGEIVLSEMGDGFSCYDGTSVVTLQPLLRG